MPDLADPRLPQSDPQRSRERYRALAEGYDASSRRQSRRLRAIEKLEIERGATVLDVACGTGLSFAPLAERVGGSGTVVGVELSPEMAQYAQARIDAGGWSNVHLRVDDAATADLSRFCFDAVLFHYAHDVLQSPPALANIFAHTRHGACVAVAGIRTVHPLLLPLNLWARLRGWRYRTSSANLDAPWRTLRPWIEEFAIESYLLGTAFVGHGRVSGAG